jgi:hypothetical protein
MNLSTSFQLEVSVFDTGVVAVEILILVHKNAIQFGFEPARFLLFFCGAIQKTHALRRPPMDCVFDPW